MKIQRTATITLGGTRCSVGEMRQLINGLPDEAVIDIDYTNFDNSPDPREHSYVTLEVTYP